MNLNWHSGMKGDGSLDLHRRFWVVAALAVLCVPADAQSQSRRATFRGGESRNEGKCTIEVVVDSVAEVEVRGDNAVLRTISGQPAQWRRFECSGRMPDNPANSGSRESTAGAGRIWSAIRAAAVPPWCALRIAAAVRKATPST